MLPISPAFPNEFQSPQQNHQSALEEETTRQRRESFANEVEQEIQDLITHHILKNVSIIYSEQFHNIPTDVVVGKIARFKVDNSTVQLGLSIDKLRQLIQSCETK